MQDVKETRELVRFVVSLVVAVEKATADGKIDVWDSPRFMATLNSAMSAFGDIQKVPSELLDLDQFEVGDLVLYVKTELNLSHSRLEPVVKSALDMIVKFYQLVDYLREPAVSPPPVAPTA